MAEEIEPEPSVARRRGTSVGMTAAKTIADGFTKWLPAITLSRNYVGDVP